MSLGNNLAIIGAIYDKLMFLLVELFQSVFGKNVLLLVLFSKLETSIQL